MPITSVNKANEIYTFLKTTLVDKKIMLYSSGSGDKKDFENVNDRFVEYDVLIYTPTLTAGVSFDISHFDVMYCWFDVYSCSADVCV